MGLLAHRPLAFRPENRWKGYLHCLGLVPLSRPPQPTTTASAIIKMRSAGRIIAVDLQSKPAPKVRLRNQRGTVGQAVLPGWGRSCFSAATGTDGSPERRGPEARTIETDGAKPALSVQSALETSGVERSRCASKDRRGAAVVKVDENGGFLDGALWGHCPTTAPAFGPRYV